MRNGLRPKVIEYQEAFDKFVAGRKEINTAIEQGKIGDVFEQLLEKAEKHDAVAMDIIAYYYKSGIVNYLKENYIKYLYWETLACAKGNNFAIEKMQFIYNNAYEEILDNEDFEVIAYLNGLTEENFIYFLGKEISKTLVKKLEINVENLSKMPEEFKPFRNEYLLEFKKVLNDALPEIIEKLK